MKMWMSSAQAARLFGVAKRTFFDRYVHRGKIEGHLFVPDKGARGGIGHYFFLTKDVMRLKKR